MGDDSIQGQLAEMSNNPEMLRQTQDQSEDLLKKVAGELVEGVKAYRDEFEPNADDLIAKFSVREFQPIYTAPLSTFFIIIPPAAQLIHQRRVYAWTR